MTRASEVSIISLADVTSEATLTSFMVWGQSLSNSIIIVIDYFASWVLFLALQPQESHDNWGYHHKLCPHELRGRADLLCGLWLVTDHLPTLGHTPIPLLSVDTAEDRGRGRGQHVAEVTTELSHRVLELREQPHQAIGRGWGRLKAGNIVRILNIQLESLQNTKCWFPHFSELKPTPTKM